eukprot:g3049.t1
MDIDMEMDSSLDQSDRSSALRSFLDAEGKSLDEDGAAVSHDGGGIGSGDQDDDDDDDGHGHEDADDETLFRSPGARSPGVASSAGLRTGGGVSLGLDDSVGGGGEEDDLEGLRRLVADHISKRSYQSASFFAASIAALSGGAPDDIFLVAETYYTAGEYQRAIHVLEQHAMLDDVGGALGSASAGRTGSGSRAGNGRGLRARYLAAKCRAECKQWSECIALLDEGLLRLPPHGGGMASPAIADVDDMEAIVRAAGQFEHKRGEEVNLLANVCLLQGQAHEATENRDRAVRWYQAALQCDVYCFDAFDRLVSHHMLPSSKHDALLKGLRFEADETWLRLSYEALLQRHKGQREVGQKFRELEERLAIGMRQTPAHTNHTLVTAKAECLFYDNDSRAAYEITRELRELDPYELSCVPVHLAAMVDLEMKSELFFCAHQLVDAYPDKAIAWFAVGCYYYLVQKFDNARRYFNKATNLDANFTPAWIGFGHAFAAQDESDQAMNAYRTTQRLFPGCHMPALFTGMEYLRTNNLVLAEQFFGQARLMCSSDPLIHNELGVVHYKNQNYKEAIACFERTLDLCSHVSQPLLTVWEPTICNLGHAHRKSGNWRTAATYYEQAIGLVPRRAATYAALGFTRHLQGMLDAAIDHYHKALGLKPEDAFASDMLSRALTDVVKAAC